MALRGLWRPCGQLQQLTLQSSDHEPLLLGLVSPGAKLVILLGELLVLHSKLPPEPILLVTQPAVLLPKLVDHGAMSRLVG
jgi:hypothetical protein